MNLWKMKVDMSLETRKMNYEKTEITVIHQYFSDLLRIMSKQTRTFNLPSW